MVSQLSVLLLLVDAGPPVSTHPRLPVAHVAPGSGFGSCETPAMLCFLNCRGFFGLLFSYPFGLFIPRVLDT